MELQTTECIGIENKGREYTDCMEFSLLRCLQMFTYNPLNKEIDDEVPMGRGGCESIHYRTSYIPEIYENPLLKEFVREFPHIYSSRYRYRHNNIIGAKQRASWSTLVSDRGTSLEYYRNDEAELFTSVENIVKFFNTFFYELNLGLNIPDSDYKKCVVNEVPAHQNIDESNLDETTVDVASESEIVATPLCNGYASDEWKDDDQDDNDYDVEDEYDYDKYVRNPAIDRKRDQLQVELDKIANGFTHFVNQSLQRHSSSVHSEEIMKKSISMKLKNINYDCRQMTMHQIVAIVSRPEAMKHRQQGEDAAIDDNTDEYYQRLAEDPGAWYDVIVTESELAMNIDGFNYNWSLYEVYFADQHRHLFKNNFITGHSVIFNT